MIILRQKETTDGETIVWLEKRLSVYVYNSFIAPMNESFSPWLFLLSDTYCFDLRGNRVKMLDY